MLKGGIVSRLLILSTLYLTFIGIYLVISSNTLLLIIPVLIIMATLLSVKTREYSKPILLATSIFYAINTTTALLAFIPLAFLIPYLFAREINHNDINKSTTTFIGPSTYGILKYLMGLLVFTIVDTRILTPITILFTIVFVYSLVYFIRLSKTKIDVLEIPKSVLLGRTSAMLLGVYTHSTVYLVLERNDGYRKIYRISGRSIVKFELPSEHTGPNIVIVSISIVDKWGFAKRIMKPIRVKYVVVPATSKLISMLRRKVFSRKELSSIISGVEVSLIELGGLKTSIVNFIVKGTEEVVDVVRDLLRKRIDIQRSIAEFMYRLTEVLGEDVDTTRSIWKRSRTGEYIGVRDYTPGDSLRDIHWKKSLSKSSLVVKEYSTLTLEESSTDMLSGLEPLVFLELFALDSKELDKMMFTVLSIYLSIVKRNPMASSVLILVFADYMLIIKGKSLDILYKLYRVLEKSLPSFFYGYESISGVLEPKVIDELLKSSYKPKTIATLITVNKLFADKVIKVLAKNNLLPPKPFTIVHSQALSFKYGILRHELSKIGYLYVEPRSIASINTISAGNRGRG